MPRQHHLTSPPKVTREKRFALAQLRNRVLIGTIRRPQFTPKTAHFLRRSSLRLLHPSSTDPTHHPKRHLDPISRFATIPFLDRPTHRLTDRPTDGIDDRSTPVRYARYIDREQRAKTIAYYDKSKV